MSCRVMLFPWSSFDMSLVEVCGGRIKLTNRTRIIPVVRRKPLVNTQQHPVLVRHLICFPLFPTTMLGPFAPSRFWIFSAICYFLLRIARVRYRDVIGETRKKTVYLAGDSELRPHFRRVLSYCIAQRSRERSLHMF